MVRAISEILETVQVVLIKCILFSGQEVAHHLNAVDLIVDQVQGRALGQAIVQGHDIDPDPDPEVSMQYKLLHFSHSKDLKVNWLVSWLVSWYFYQSFEINDVNFRSGWYRISV